MKTRFTKMKKPLVEYKIVTDIIYTPQEVCFRLFLLRLRPKLREIRQNSGKVQKFYDIFSKTI